MSYDFTRIVAPLLCWYDAERRILPWREDPTPYHVWISEIMLQQTRVEAVIDYYNRFLKRFPDVTTLALADMDEVLSYWQGLGYYRRCEMLHRAAKEIVSSYGGEIPGDFKLLLALPGIGRYTAAAVMSIGFGRPYAAVDGNVLRVMMRLTDCDDCIDENSTKKRVEKELTTVMPHDRTSAFTQALMDLGATICLPNGEPKCSICPLMEFCLGRFRSDMLPVRKTKKPRSREERTVLVLCCGDEIALRKRPEKGLLAKMWEFPNELGTFTVEEVKRRYNGDVTPLGRAKHIFSHIEWHMTGYRVEVKEKLCDPSLIWVKKEEMADYAIPSAFGYFKKTL